MARTWPSTIPASKSWACRNEVAEKRNHRYEIRAVWNPLIKLNTIAGVSIGIVIRIKRCQAEAPSSLAASYRSVGISRIAAPLRERKDDIPLLASHFIETVVKELRCPRPRLTRAGKETLLNYDWPGNIRELCNVIQRAAIFAQGGALQFDLPMGNTSVELTSQKLAIGDDSGVGYVTEGEIRRRERDNLSVVLQKTGWRIKGAAGAAELLRVRPTTLASGIEKLV